MDSIVSIACFRGQRRPGRFLGAGLMKTLLITKLLSVVIMAASLQLAAAGLTNERMPFKPEFFPVKGTVNNEKNEPLAGATVTLVPAMMKFNHNMDGGWLGGNFQQKLGNIMIMRMAEVYLIAAEAALRANGDGAAAAKSLNELRRRATRNVADFNTSTGMQLTTATMNDVFDEYARELCGEYNRWALLKRNKAFETRLQAYNRTAALNFVPGKHYNRPIPFNFLNQINNSDEFGTNGY